MFGKNSLLFLGVLALPIGAANQTAWAGSIVPSEPASDFVSLDPTGITQSFCAEWNPDFPYIGGTCCGKRVMNSAGKIRGKRRRGPSCPPQRFKSSFCTEMTDDQRSYIEGVVSGKIADPLAYLESELRFRKVSDPQAVCTPNDGFLAWGRPLVPTDQNKIRLRRPDRCVHFGTDRMVALLSWLGVAVQQRAQQSSLSDLHLIVGDISAPRGGCLSGAGGHGGHFSHMTGQDVDLGFVDPMRKFEGRAPAHERFDRRFEPKWNWWLLKKIFRNPYVCVKAVFLDRRLIAKLHKEAKDDPEWEALSPFVRHVRHHRNHFHIRIGADGGVPGCRENTIDEESSVATNSEP